MLIFRYLLLRFLASQRQKPQQRKTDFHARRRRKSHVSESPDIERTQRIFVYKYTQKSNEVKPSFHEYTPKTEVFPHFIEIYVQLCIQKCAVLLDGAGIMGETKAITVYKISRVRFGSIAAMFRGWSALLSGTSCTRGDDYAIT